DQHYLTVDPPNRDTLWMYRRRAGVVTSMTGTRGAENLSLEHIRLSMSGRVVRLLRVLGRVSRWGFVSITRQSRD
ncbi:MAG: hypothetical protein ACR2Q4_24380, partial [Geminicoccaceae bacterium]